MRLSEWTESLGKQSPDELTMLPGFMFSLQDAAKFSRVSVERVERFLEVFSCGPDERNTSFTALNEFNISNSAPILSDGQGSYILLQHYSLLEAIYESPFFWMGDDDIYASTAFANRGRFAESFVSDRLDAVFGAARVLRNVDIYKGKDRIAEADTLVLYGDRAIVIQTKSKRLTIEARKGNDRQLKDDFKKVVQNSYDQALLCVEALIGDGFRFVGSPGTEIRITHKPRIIFPICVVSDHYPALAFQARQFLKTTVTTSIQPPLVTDLFALDTFAEMLSTPLHFFNYLALRARFGDKLVISQEVAALGYHLNRNLWFDTKYDMMVLGDEFSGDLDIAMLARRAGAPGEKTPKGILTRFDNLAIGKLLTEIEKVASPELTGLGLLLLQLSSNTATLLSAGIDRIVSATKRDGGGHDISVADEIGGSGITIHCNRLPEEIARERLSTHCKVRKYDTKANAWYGLLLNPETGEARAALLIEEAWAPDPEMDSFMAIWPKQTPIPISQLASGPRKIGRNEPCSCGSGKKYKKCCLNV